MTTEINPQAQLDFIGVIREFQILIRDIPPGPRTPETSNLLKKGQLFWAGDEFLRPGLYIWNGVANVLVESKHNIMAKMQAAVQDPNAPVTKEDWEAPPPHNQEEE